jgi:hypothetical protein
MRSNPTAGRRMTLTLAGLIAVASATLVLAVSGTHEGHADTGHSHADVVALSAKTTAKQAKFQDEMRKLWEDHITWTRLAIVSFAHDLPDLPATQARLLRNQEDIGNAVKPYYGRAAGNQLTKLLREHIIGAVAVLQAAKAGDTAALAAAKTAWVANGREVADFLSAANRRNWPRATMRHMMRTHLDQTIQEAVAQLTGDYASSVRVYDEIEHHILVMADALSDGIIAQFPGRFR